MESELGLIQQSIDVHYSNWVFEALDELPYNITITDPCISGHPIVFASRGFLKMCGYSKEEVVGRNGRMFQGPLTDRQSIMRIREAIREERPVQMSLLNYRKDGTAFWMLFHMSPVFSEEDGRVIHFVAVQVPISRKVTRSECELERNCFDSAEGCCKPCKIVLGCCRREVRSDYIKGSSHGLDFNPVWDTDKEIGFEESCEASDIEKQRASTAIDSVLSVLTHYAVLRGRSISSKRCTVQRPGLLNSALITSLGRIKQSFVLIDPYLPSMPVVYVSDTFLKLTGYARYEVLGRSWSFLSGSDTDATSLLQVNESIQNGQPCTVRIINYRKDKSSFWNLLHVSPVRNASGKIAYFVEVYMEDDRKGEDPKPEQRQLGAVGAVKVAVRSLTMGLPGPSR